MRIDLDPTVPRTMLELRIYWRQVRGPCARCGGPIHYDEKRYRYIVTNGMRRRVENPWALDVGHIVERDRDSRKLYAPNETRPEHARCNRSAGAAYVNRKRGWQRRIARMATLRTSRRW
jgi:hypothetical protein